MIDRAHRAARPLRVAGLHAKLFVDWNGRGEAVAGRARRWVGRGFVRRRAWVLLAATVAARTAGLAGRPARAEDAGVSFDALFARTAADAALLAAGRTLREGWAEVFARHITRALGPRPAPSTRPIGSRAGPLIAAFEVTSAEVYDRAYQAPTWPQGDSGVTIGIGYDLGYVSTAWLHEDWDGSIPAADLTRLESACEKTGGKANALLADLADIRIPYAQADSEFAAHTLPRTTGETVAALPNAAGLPPDCLGALVSLVYNRGPSFQLVGDRYAEMRAIRVHMVKKAYARIPAELRAMKRLWQDDATMRGLLIRRELEARLFEEGLNT